MSLTDSNHLALSASGAGFYIAAPGRPTDTGVAAPDDRPWPAEREEVSISVSSLTASRGWFKQWLEDAFALFNLPPNWNGYGERPVHPSALKRAARVLDSMDYDGPGPALTPRHDGSVQVEWHNGPRSVDLVVRSSGSAEAWAFSDEDEMTWHVQSTADALRLAEAVRGLFGSDV